MIAVALFGIAVIVGVVFPVVTYDILVRRRNEAQIPGRERPLAQVRF